MVITNEIFVGDCGMGGKYLRTLYQILMKYICRQ
jgi:hypothetical protein